MKKFLLKYPVTPDMMHISHLSTKEVKQKDFRELEPNLEHIVSILFDCFGQVDIR